MKDETIDQFLLDMASTFGLYCEAAGIEGDGRDNYEKAVLVPQILRRVPAPVRSVCQPHKQYTFAEVRPMLMTKIYELAMCGDASIRGAKVTGLDTTNNALLVSRSSRPFLPSAPAVKRDREEMCNHESGPRGCTRRACP